MISRPDSDPFKLIYKSLIATSISLSLRPVTLSFLRFRYRHKFTTFVVPDLDAENYDGDSKKSQK